MANKPSVYQTENGSTMYREGATGATVDLVGNYLVNNGYMDSYSGVYDSNMVSALATAKNDLRGAGDWKGQTFGDATINAILAKNQAAEDAAKQEIKDEFAAYKEETGAGWQQVYSAMANQQAQQQAAIKANTQATVDSINASRGNYQQAYEDSVRQAYINRELQKNQMGDYLAAMGYSGGLAESTLTGIQTNYEENSKNAGKELSAANQQLDRLVAEAQATGNTDLANAANEYYNNYIATLQNQQQMNYQIATDERNALTELKNYQIQQEQNKLAQQQYRDDRNDYTQSLEQQQAEQDFQTFLNTYSKKYNKRKIYEDWIQNLKNMDDPYGYNAQKIAYLRQYINQTFGKTGGSSSNGSGNNPSSSTLSAAETGILTDAGIILSEMGIDATIDYLKKKQTDGLVSEAGSAVIMKQLGLM